MLINLVRPNWNLIIVLELDYVPRKGEFVLTTNDENGFIYYRVLEVIHYKPKIGRFFGPPKEKHAVTLVVEPIDKEKISKS